MMFHHPAISRAIVGGCALAFAAVACAAPASTASEAQPGATATAGSTASTDASASQPYIGPLDAFLGTGNGGQPTAAQQADELQTRRDEEQAIASCMQALGFDYVAVDPSNDGRAQKDALRAMPPGEFAAQYGYGISTVDFNDSAVVDPNDTIVNAMTVPELSAYFHALYGDMVSIDGNGRPTKSKQDAQPPAPGQESCTEKAKIAVFGPQPDADATSSDAFTSLQDAMDAVNDSIHSDPRMDAAMTAWSACMEAKGHPGYTTFTAGRDEVQARADQVVGANKLSEVDPAALSELRAFEVHVATDEYQCSLPYERAHEVVQTELEQAFIDEHRAELEQFRDALVASGKVGKG